MKVDSIVVVPKKLAKLIYNDASFWKIYIFAGAE